MGRSICFHRSLWFSHSGSRLRYKFTNAVFATNDQQWLKLMNLTNHGDDKAQFMIHKITLRWPQTDFNLTTNDLDFVSMIRSNLYVLLVVKIMEINKKKNYVKSFHFDHLTWQWPFWPIEKPFSLFQSIEFWFLGRKAVFDISLSSSGNRADWLPVRAPRSFELIRPVRRCQSTKVIRTVRQNDNLSESETRWRHGTKL